jgi:hypothetical protein
MDAGAQRARRVNRFLPSPPAHDGAQVLQSLLPELLAGEHRAVVVLRAAVGLAHDAELIPVEVAATGWDAVFIEQRHLQLRHGNPLPPQHQPTDRFERRFGAPVDELQRLVRPANPGPVPASGQHVLKLGAAHALLVQGGVQGRH